jgi:hypothetical protein
VSGAMTALVAGVALNGGAPAFAQGKKKSPHISLPSTPPVTAQGFPVPFQATQSPVFYFKRETFQPYVGGIFTIRAGAHSVEATLREVRDCTPSPKGAALTKGKPRQTDCFALVFQTTGTLTDLTTIYTVGHAALGEFNLFLTRRSPAPGTYIYEAVINHAL